MYLNDQQVQTIRDYFKNKPVLKAYLFGSYVRGEAEEKSDVDILVELDYTQPVGLEFVSMRLDLEDLLGREVDLVSARGLSEFIGPQIHQEKELLYAR
ncbi:MAG: nucleotidyltransferase domain-containing protein [Haliscomenobacter sp.]|uniref:nucleotidyltransferase family protein n=1 Tax=Haliscomenobacter sp. TaxID=2717303 RepID=UPI0029B5FDF3|nr:nucleotidyltransferase domain-containing protein [Haliscomenobacter sp.]MDX2070642.1 nucleotidyltransferase domain-containing protein [Haliscomenobacter sp.]